MDSLYGLLTEGHITKEGFGRRFKSLEERRQQLEESIPRLQAEIDICKINQLSTEEIVSEAPDLYTWWPKLDLTEKREIVETITKKIVVGKEQVSIELCYLPPTKEMAKGWRKGRDLNPR